MHSTSCATHQVQSKWLPTCSYFLKGFALSRWRKNQRLRVVLLLWPCESFTCKAISVRVCCLARNKQSKWVSKKQQLFCQPNAQQIAYDGESFTIGGRSWTHVTLWKLYVPSNKQSKCVAWLTISQATTLNPLQTLYYCKQSNTSNKLLGIALLIAWHVKLSQGMGQQEATRSVFFTTHTVLATFLLFQ